jgi:hypothetical protein
LVPARRWFCFFVETQSTSRHRTQCSIGTPPRCLRCL